MIAAHNKLFSRPVMGEALTVFGWSLVACAIYAFASNYFLGAYPLTIEFLGTVFSLACVWLVRKQNMWTWPLGIISVVFMGIFFWQVDLVGQAGLQILFYIPVQIWGWWMWLDHSDTPRLQRLIKPMKSWEWVVVGLLYVGLTLALAPLLSTFNGVYIYWDGSIVAASILAQILLSFKRPGSWLLWTFPVNVAAIGLYSVTGAYMFAALYVVYLVNAWFGRRQWLAESRAGVLQSANKPLMDASLSATD